MHVPNEYQYILQSHTRHYYHDTTGQQYIMGLYKSTPCTLVWNPYDYNYI